MEPSPIVEAEQNDYMLTLLLAILQSLVDEQETISIELVPSDGYSTFKIGGSRAAISILVGPKGQMARALRTVLAGSSAKLGRRFSMDLVERPIS